MFPPHKCPPSPTSTRVGRGGFSEERKDQNGTQNFETRMAIWSFSRGRSTLRRPRISIGARSPFLDGKGAWIQEPETVKHDILFSVVDFIIQSLTSYMMVWFLQMHW